MNDQGPDELLLSYAELGRRLGITSDGARIRARRKRWPVIRGNDGQAKVRVLATDLPEQAPDTSGQEPNMFAERLDELKDELHEARQQAEQWRTAAEQARVEAAGYRAQAEAKDTLITELKAMLAAAREPWWRRWRP
jgi:hypothetical protein